MFISNYGLFWQRKYVHFGLGGNEGTLLGRMSRKESFFVDFREQIGIYVLYDKDCIPIYVGQAGNGNATLLTRLKHHTADYLCNRWEYFTWFGLRRVNAKGRLAAYDSIEKPFKEQGGSILDEMEPKFNKEGPKIKDAVDEYHQAVDENVVEMSNQYVTAGIEELKKQQKAIEKQLKRKVNSRKVGSR